MSTTTELLAAKQAHQQLRNRFEALAGRWDARADEVIAPAGDVMRNHAARLRALLDDA